MAAHTSLTPAGTIVRVCLLPATAVALGGGLEQLARGAPAGVLPHRSRMCRWPAKEMWEK